MAKEKTGKDWFDDIEPSKVDKACEIPPQIDLPAPGDPAILVAIQGEPKEVELTSRDDTMLVVDANRLTEPQLYDATMILPKSLRFNMAKAFQRNGQDFRKANLTGTTWRIWATTDKGSKYYQAELMPSG